MSGAQARLEERRDQALADLVALDRQVEADEIDPATAERLRASYEVEASDALADIARTPGDAVPSPAGRPAGGRTRRRLAGALVAVVAVAASAVLLPRWIQDRPEGGFVTGNVAADIAGGPAGDTAAGSALSEVSNAEMEEVVAANPDVVPMRLALAHRYLDDGDYRKAVEHYTAVLDREPNPEAMSHLGWILFNDGETQLAAQLLEAARERDPDAPEAMWFLANVRLYGQDDPEAAIRLLQRLLDRDDLSPAVRDQVTTALDDARARTEDGL